MGDKRLPVIIMLTAGTVVAFACLGFGIELIPSILYVSVILFIFYFIGLIINKIIIKINADAEKRALELAKEKELEEDDDDDDEDMSDYVASANDQASDGDEK